MERMTTSKAGTIFAGIVSIALGLVLFMNPNGSTVAIVQSIGWALIVGGGVSLACALSSWNVILMQADLYMGLLGLLFGFLRVSMPGIFVAWLFILLGIYVIVLGFESLAAVNLAGRLTGSNSTGSRIGALLVIALGVVVMLSPMGSASIAMSITGIVLVALGIGKIMEVIRMPGRKG